jgi:hypothetical protein
MAISVIDATSTGSTGTVMVSGNMPAFKATQSAGVSIASGGSYIVTFDTKTFDTATCFNNTGSTVTLNGLSVPAWSFCPNIAGYYSVQGNVFFTASVNTAVLAPQIFKNGGEYQVEQYHASTTKAIGGCVATTVYLNGTSDYLGIYVYQDTGSSQTTSYGLGRTSFSATLVRAT